MVYMNIHNNIAQSKNMTVVNLLDRLDLIYLVGENAKDKLYDIMSDIGESYRTGKLTLHEFQILLSVVSMVVSKWRRLSGE